MRSDHASLERRQSLGSSSRTVASSLRPTGSSAEDAWLGPVIDDSVASPPGDPEVGDRYIIPCNPTGAWVGHEGEIATWVGDGWEFTVPVSGSTVWVINPSYFTTFLDNPSDILTSDVDIQFWFPHHLIDAAHTIYSGVVTDRLSTPPVGTDFATYIVIPFGSGAWAGHDNQLAISICNRVTGANSWAFVTPPAGSSAWVADEALYYVFNGTIWEPLPQWVLNRGVLNDLSNISGSPIDGDALVYNGSTLQWEPGEPEVDLSLGDLNNVDAGVDGAGLTGTVLTNSGGEWVASFPNTISHTLGIPHSNVADAVDTAPVGKYLRVVGGSGQWAADDGPAAGGTGPAGPEGPPGPTGPAGAGGGIVGSVYYPSPSGPWAVYSGTGFTVADASGGTITFATSKATAWGISDSNVVKTVASPGTTWVFGLGTPPSPLGVIFSFTAQ